MNVFNRREGQKSFMTMYLRHDISSPNKVAYSFLVASQIYISCIVADVMITPPPVHFHPERSSIRGAVEMTMSVSKGIGDAHLCRRKEAVVNDSGTTEISLKKETKTKRRFRTAYSNQKSTHLSTSAIYLVSGVLM